MQIGFVRVARQQNVVESTRSMLRTAPTFDSCDIFLKNIAFRRIRSLFIAFQATNEQTNFDFNPDLRSSNPDITFTW